MRKALLLTCTLVAALTGCHPPAPKGPPLDTIDRSQVREAVFRHLFENNASATQQDASVYCLEVDDKRDPCATLLDRFKSHQPQVVPASACTESTGGVFARGASEATARPGLSFSVGHIEIHGDQATAGASYYEGGLSAALYAYTLRRTDGGWEVTEQILLMIS